MKRPLGLRSNTLADIELRAIVESDKENLRQWKNANRFAFFYQEIITPEQQDKWFAGYLERERDFMFIVLVNGEAIGCLGFRMLDGHADVYNVILGNPAMGKRGWMRNAMRLLCSYIATGFARDIRVRVLRTNPAVEWYRKIGFREIAVHDSYVELQLDLALFQPCQCLAI